MKLLYYQGSINNFGDDLNSIIWPSLAPDLFIRDDEQGFLGIGTVIGMSTPEVKSLHVFSSGVGYNPVNDLSLPTKFWCVRGPLSASHLNLSPKIALTDGAILLPQIMNVKSNTRFSVSIIPHWETIVRGGWTEVSQALGYNLIDPTHEIPDIIEAIIGSQLILTESLHGAIVADAYGIPWLPFCTSGNFSLFKWEDWSASVGLKIGIGVVSPPTIHVRRDFGKPVLNGNGLQSISKQEIDGEIRNRLSSSNNSSRGRLLSLKPLRTLRYSPRLRILNEFTLGISVEKCAEQLYAISQQAPFLSASSTRDQLTDEMLLRLKKLTSELGCKPNF